MTTTASPSAATARWAVILGASSGFGEAAALALASAGYHIAGVDFDRRPTVPSVERIVAEIQGKGREAIFANMNAADAERRHELLDALAEKCRTQGTDVGVLVHSLAFGTLRPFLPATDDAPPPVEGKAPPMMDDRAMNTTLDVMAHSLVYWTQDLVARRLLGRHGRVFGMTSSGGTRVWPTYGAVSAAKAALESHCRHLALELAPRGISVNAILAGVTDTPALRKIPGHEELMASARKKNPTGRLGTPEDVARALVVLCHPDLDWMTGNTIGIDAGEDNVG